LLFEPDRQGARAVAGLAVAGLHLVLIAVLVSQSAAVRDVLPTVLRLRVIPAVRPPPPPPPIRPLDLAPTPAIPMPDFKVAAAAQPPLATQAARAAPQAARFGAASGDAGLGIDVAASAGGGDAGRGSLADFEAAVKRQVLARKRQPSLTWDRRNTCVVAYTVTITSTGALAGMTIEPCAVPEINQAARDAVLSAAPFPSPPDLGARTYAVRGSLVFRP
jgi:protein TonB